jgi:hypothetical protein
VAQTRLEGLIKASPDEHHVIRDTRQVILERFWDLVWEQLDPIWQDRFRSAHPGTSDRRLRHAIRHLLVRWIDSLSGLKNAEQGTKTKFEALPAEVAAKLAELRSSYSPDEIGKLRT